MNDFAETGRWNFDGKTGVFFYCHHDMPFEALEKEIETAGCKPTEPEDLKKFFEATKENLFENFACAMGMHAIEMIIATASYQTEKDNFIVLGAYVKEGVPVLGLIRLRKFIEGHSAILVMAIAK